MAGVGGGVSTSSPDPRAAVASGGSPGGGGGGGAAAALGGLNLSRMSPALRLRQSAEASKGLLPGHTLLFHLVP